MLLMYFDYNNRIVRQNIHLFYFQLVPFFMYFILQLGFFVITWIFSSRDSFVGPDKFSLYLFGNELAKNSVEYGFSYCV